MTAWCTRDGPSAEPHSCMKQRHWKGATAESLRTARASSPAAANSSDGASKEEQQLLLPPRPTTARSRKLAQPKPSLPPETDAAETRCKRARRQASAAGSRDRSRRTAARLTVGWRTRQSRSRRRRRRWHSSCRQSVAKGRKHKQTKRASEKRNQNHLSASARSEPLWFDLSQQWQLAERP